MSKEIETLRKKIDHLDNQIIELLQARFEVTDKIGELKKNIKKEVTDPNREQRIYDKLPNESIVTIYKTIISESKIRQGKE